MSENAENPYRRTLDELLSHLAQRTQPISHGELSDWARQKRIGPLTLQLLIEDLRGSHYFEETAADAANGVPMEGVEQVPAQATGQDEAETESKEKEEVVPEPHCVVAPEPPSASRVESPTQNPAGAETLDDPALLEAIQYLNDYRSVGVIRFQSDMKRLGVAESTRVLNELVKLDYAGISSLGVVNATEKLPHMKRRVTLGEVFSGLVSGK